MMCSRSCAHHSYLISSEYDALRFGSERGEDHDRDSDCTCHHCKREHIITAVVSSNGRLQRRVHRCNEIPSLVGNPGNVPRALSGDNSFKSTGMMPQAPWTTTCIKKAPTASHIALVEYAQSGSTKSKSIAAMMMVRRLPKFPDSEPNEIPAMMAPIF